jgi:hypothetical protein
MSRADGMIPGSLQYLTQQLELGEQLRAGRDAMFEPQDLPGRYGRVVQAIDRVLQAIDCSAVVGGGWAVWRHGFVARITQNIDIVVPADRLDEFVRVAAAAGLRCCARRPCRRGPAAGRNCTTRNRTCKWMSCPKASVLEPPRNLRP